MPAMIWDTALGAWVEATPQIYDSGLQAYGDSTGLTYDPEAGAWSERWGEKGLKLFDNGDCTDVTGGWRICNPTMATMGALSVGNTLGVYITNDTAGAMAAHTPYVATVRKIDVTQYKKATITVSSYRGSRGSGAPYARIGLANTLGTEYTGMEPYIEHLSNTASSGFNLVLDITGSSGQKYFVVNVYYAYIYISKIVLT